VTIVVGYDGSDCAKAALRATATAAKLANEEVVVVFAYYISPLGGGDVHDFKSALEAHADTQTKEALDELAAAGVSATAQHVSSKPADAILAVAEQTGARLVVVGGMTHGAVAGAILGSVVLNVIQRSHVPILVVPE
jgi:nucleotide-binding universal stress UspA family protein